MEAPSGASNASAYHAEMDGDTKIPLILFPTCVMEAMAPAVGEAVVRTLRDRGFAPSIPPDATCCGQPAWNAGYPEEAATVARTTLAALTDAPSGPVCVPAGSCATMMRVYWPELFRRVGDEEARAAAVEIADRIVEFTRLVADDRRQADRQGTVAYHHSCHMLRELHIHDEPVALLTDAGYAVADWDDDDRCCGFGGLFSVKEPEISVAMADEKIDGLPLDGIEALVGSDLSCLLQLEGRMRRRGIDLPVRHIAELLDPSGPTDVR